MASTTATSCKPLNILIHTFHATGHVLPTQAVAQELVHRGHNVLWVTSPDQEARVLASGASFLPTEALPVVDAALAAADPKTLLETAHILVGSGRLLAQVADLRRALATFKPDILLNDALPYGARALYELGEVPFWATLGVVPMYLPNCEGDAKPRSALGMILTDPDLGLPAVNPERAQLGLPPLSPDEWTQYSPLLHIQASCASLEFGAHPPNTHYVGPLVATSSGQSTAQDLPRWWVDVTSTTRKVVGITQGTFATDPTSLLVPAISALQDEDDLLLVVPSPRIEEIKSHITLREETVRVANWVPYAELLPRSRVLVTNGGYGSVTQALAHGLPLVCAGASEDKKDTAARMAWVGAGVDLGGDRPRTELIRKAVRMILENEDEYRARASKVRDELNVLGGASRACDLVEQAVGWSRT